MAKKRKTTRGRKTKKIDSPQHELPSGFWRQVSAILLIALSLLLVVSWFGGGGQLLNWMRDFFLSVLGSATYIVPIIAIYVAVQTLKAEDNRLPLMTKFSAILIVVWMSGLTGLFRTANEPSTGGAIGDGLNNAMLALVNMPIAVFVYLLFIVITGIFFLRVSFRDVGHFLARLIGRAESGEDAANVSVMRKAASADAKESGPLSADFKLNAGVPMMDSEDQKSAKLTSLK
ncbi:MAG TPA: DNA translocase FtsK 4TM domain-containing protein, partial [Patescibacteria group bacterium]|nr:DNA translocase FtsK 4TM domain-containing protein [Patescibacteria group bacterium]